MIHASEEPARYYFDDTELRLTVSALEYAALSRPDDGIADNTPEDYASIASTLRAADPSTAIGCTESLMGKLAFIVDHYACADKDGVLEDRQTTERVVGELSAAWLYLAGIAPLDQVEPNAQ